jgi:hypothetical protein
MQTFSDKNGDSWEIELTVGIMEEVKDALDIDLLDPVGEDSQLIVDLSPVMPENIKRFCDLIYFLCKEQCDSKSFTDKKEFTRLLDSKTIKSAYDAFFKEWQDFFQSLDRMDIAEAMMKIRELVKEGVTKIIVEIKKMEFPTGNLSMNLPESQE